MLNIGLRERSRPSGDWSCRCVDSIFNAERKGAVMRFRIHSVFVVMVATLAGAAQASTDLMAGKVRTERTIRLQAVIDASPSEVFRLWTTPAGVKTFLGPDARIDPRPGGEYTILFSPAQDPQGLSHGTKGAHVLKIVEGSELAFEWITFAGDALLGTSGPPVAPRSVRDVTPLPTWVELRFIPVDGGKRTSVLFAHYGFAEGERWRQSYEWFAKAWAGVLNNLQTACAKK